jgi:NTP pyrophosphatase (non-canonical NTP hydrolase)
MDNSIEELLQQLRQFRDERNWAQFHNAKDLALALSIEAAELNEQFLWKTAEQADAGRVREELADVLLYAFQLADKYGWDIPQLMQEKMILNAEKHPAIPLKSSVVEVPLNTSEQVYTVPTVDGKLIRPYGNTGYGYIELKADTLIPIENGEEKETKLAHIKGTYEILDRFVREHVVGDKAKGVIVIKEFLESEIPVKFKAWLNKKKTYEQAIQEYLKSSPQTGQPIISQGQRVVRFGIYLPSVPQSEHDQYILH